MEGLSKGIHDVQVVRKAPIISHLFFADDSLLFARANTEETGRIKHIFSEYQRTYGKMVKFDKSEVPFSGNMGEDSKEVIRARLGFKGVIRNSRYLSLPVVFGRLKKEVFKLVIDRVWKKVKGWNVGFLSTAGKEVLIIVVAHAIPTYIMSYYRILDQCSKDIGAPLAKFWWGSQGKGEG